MISLIENIETVLTREECHLDKLSLCAALSKISAPDEDLWQKPVSGLNRHYARPISSNGCLLFRFSRSSLLILQAFWTLMFRTYQLSLHTLAEFEEASQNSQSVAKKLQTTWLSAIRAGCDSSRNCRLKIIADLKEKIMDPTLAET